EEALQAFTGTIVFISHDRYFINCIATQVVEVDQGRLTTFLGNYDDYLAANATPSNVASPLAAPPSQPKERSAPVSPERSRSRRKDLAREIDGIQKRLKAVEVQIQELEARLAEIGLTLADPELYRDGGRAREAAQARKETEERVAWLMKEWEELSLRLSIV